MIKRFIPFAHAKNIYEIEPSFYKKYGIKVIFTDLDNTLDNFKVLEPSKENYELKEKIEALGIKLIILSNNTSDRVSIYAKKLGIIHKSKMRKPFSRKLKAYIKELGVNKDEVVLIGDQIITDTIAGNGAGIKVVFTERLTESEPIWTRINRKFEKPIKKKLIKKKLLIDWRERL